MDWIVAGLGNPGRRYAGTRHDVGFALVDLLAREHGAAFRPRDDVELAGPQVMRGATVLLARPQRYMNRSGPPLGRLLDEAAVPVDRLLVACDDVNLPLGRVRLRPAGSSGGHNGLKSIIEVLGEGFPRLRLGVGGAPPGTDLAEWVLAPFDEADAGDVTNMLGRASSCVQSCWEQGRVEPRTSDPEPEATTVVPGLKTGDDDE